MKRTKRVLGLALAAVMCMGLLAGCGGTPSNSDTADETSGTETSEKVLNIATIGETTTLSPLYYEGLVKYVDGEIQPVLAEDWELSEDGTQLTFYLRQGVTFHDGEPFNAEAAIANIESWHINPSFASLPGVVNYTNIEAVDEYTIRLTYDTPYFAYINDFCWPDVCTMISPKLITQGDFQTVNGYAGTGPYIYDEYVAGQYTTFVRNENYWGEQPYYDKIVAKYIPDNASRVQALQTGEIDLIYGSAELSYEDYNQATAIEGIEGKFAPSGSTIRNIILNFNGNLADLSVRQALAYAIDKEAISEGLTYGYEPVANTIVPEGTPYSDICGTVEYSYDVDKANQLLDDAGWKMNESTGIREKDGTPLHVVFTCPTDDSTIGSIATLIQSQLAEVGIEVEIKSMEKMEWYASYMEPTGWDITAMTAGFFNYAMPQCWFSAMMAQMPEDVSIPLLDNSDEFISALSEFKTCNDDTRLRELFELLINTDLDQVLDVPLTHQMDMIVYNTDKIADYNFASDYAFLAALNTYALWCGVILLGFTLKLLFSTLSTTVSHTATFQTLKEVRIKIADKLSRVPMGYIIDQSSGRFKDVIVDRVESMEPILAHLVPEMTSNLFVPLCIIVYLFILDWRMALASLVTLPIGFLCYMGMSRGYSERFSGLMKRVQKMNATIIEYVGGIEVIKAFNQSANSYQKYSDAVNDDARYAVDWMKDTQLFMSMSNTIWPSVWQ